jgi:hypothetical protein
LPSSFVWLSLAAFAGGACGGSIGGGAAVPLDDFEREVLDVYCQFAVACEAMPDRATCLGGMRLDVDEIATLKAGIASGIVDYDGQAARACIDVFRSFASCKRTSISDERLAPCDDVFRGKLPPGSACFFSEECADEGTCAQTDCVLYACCMGTCTAKPAPIPAGGDCSAPLAYDSCVPGTTCVITAQGSTCKAPIAAGGRCDRATDRCIPAYECRNVDPGTGLGTCTPPPERGEPCGTGDVTNQCNDLRDSCDPATNVCTAHVPVGGACDGQAGAHTCVEYARCDASTCVPRLGPGETCDPVLSNECLGNLECEPATNRCTLPPPGGSCR